MGVRFETGPRRARGSITKSSAIFVDLPDCNPARSGQKLKSGHLHPARRWADDLVELWRRGAGSNRLLCFFFLIRMRSFTVKISAVV
jgi:hypothetical protein